MRVLFLASLSILLSNNVFAQTVTRGPYLQTPTDSSIIVMWRTNVNTNTKVWYGNSPTALSDSITISSTTTEHSIIISGLNPYTKYYYAVGTTSGKLVGPSPNHFFTTHPVPGTEQPIRVWAIGDFGKGNTAQANVKNSYVTYADSVNTDLWLWLGDNAYTDGKDSEYQSNVFGYTGFNDVFSWLPFYPTPGNHDYGEVWAQSTFFGIPYTNIPLEDHVGPYFDIVDVPENAEAGGFPSSLEVFYSFDYGNVHFLSLNSEVYDFTNTFDGVNEMIAWITQDLSQNDKLFTVAYFHQPPYSKGSHDSDDAFELVMKAMREKVIPALESFDIDLVICGHSHVYERSFLINGHYGASGTFNSLTMLKDGSDGNLAGGNPYLKDTIKTNNEGTVYVVCGNGGSSETSPALNHPVMYFNDGGDTAYGSFTLDIYKNRLDGKYLSVNGSILDDFTILKTNLTLNDIGNFSICEGDSVLVEADWSGGSDDLSFAWSTISGDTSVQLITPDSTSQYILTVTDLLTGQIASDTFNIILNPLPPIPVITNSSDTLFAQPGYTYQWYLNGISIFGATNNFYIPVVNGNYTVEILSGGCGIISSVYAFTTVSINEFLNSFVSIYPNPASQIVFIEIIGTQKLNSVALFDLSGKEIINMQVNSNFYELNVNNISEGIYFLNCNIENTTKVFKLLVEK